MEGYAVLKELGDVISQAGGAVSGGKSAAALGKSMGAVDVASSSPAYRAILDLSNRFYSIIPHVTESRARVCRRA